jgi:hypothetical protein
MTEPEKKHQSWTAHLTSSVSSCSPFACESTPSVNISWRRWALQGQAGVVTLQTHRLALQEALQRLVLVGRDVPA